MRACVWQNARPFHVHHDFTSSNKVNLSRPHTNAHSVGSYPTTIRGENPHPSTNDGKEIELYRDSASKPAGATTNHYNPSGGQEQTI